MNFSSLFGVQGISLLVIAMWALPNMCTTYIYPDEIGVRRSLTAGIESQDFHQGRHLDLPLVHRWYRLPRSLQYLGFTDQNDLDLRTREGNLIHVSLTIVYRIVPDEAHLLAREGLADNYPDRVRSAAEGFLLEHLAQMSNADIQNPQQRQQIALSAIPELNHRLDQYHVELDADGVVIRSISFDGPYEARLQAKQLFAVQAELDTAMENESKAKQKTDTVQKGIDKDVAVEREDWNQRIELARKATETEIAHIQAEAVEYDMRVRAEADAYFEKLGAKGDRQIAEAEALGERLRSEALSSRAGRTYSAIQAVKKFELGDIQLNSYEPEFLLRFGSMAAWRRFFGGE